MPDSPELPSELLLLAHNAIRQSHPPINSELIAIQPTPYTGGLGAYAVRAIPAGTQIYAAGEPFLNVVYGPFKKEVCAYCFAYDRGRKMKNVERSSVSKDKRGIAWFCSEDCQRAWSRRIGEHGSQALSQVSSGLAKTCASKQEFTESGNPMTPAQIEEMWENAERSSIPKNMPLLQHDDDQDTVFFLLDGILARHRRPNSWNAFLALNPSLQPYESAALLSSHIRIFHYLRYHLPPTLRVFCTAETVLALITRDHGNSFGIFEDELGRDGEMLGYGTWTDASFFNHSCSANLSKRRQGRAYTFTARRDIPAGEELSINYIEDAVEDSADVRRKRLQAGWGFLCSCSRCMHESAGMFT